MASCFPESIYTMVATHWAADNRRNDGPCNGLRILSSQGIESLGEISSNSGPHPARKPANASASQVWNVDK